MSLIGKKKVMIPPVPKWMPSFGPDPESVISTFVYYSNGKRDFVIFKNCTIVLVQDGLDDENAANAAKLVLNNIFGYHPDMHPQSMDDGNILVTYNHPAYNVVFEHLAQHHWTEIETNYMNALCTDEVLITPLGPNKFDAFGKKALWGRCYFFMDAQRPEVLKIVRKSAYRLTSPSREEEKSN